jgi:hypothetical protein
VTLFLILSPTYFLIVVNKLEAPFNIELDSDVSSKTLSGLTTEIGSKTMAWETEHLLTLLFFSSKPNSPFLVHQYSISGHPMWPDEIQKP